MSKYKKDKTHLPVPISLVSEYLQAFSIPPDIFDWHQFDSLLALVSGLRYCHSQHIS